MIRLWAPFPLLELGNCELQILPDLPLAPRVQQGMFKMPKDLGVVLRPEMFDKKLPNVPLAKILLDPRGHKRVSNRHLLGLRVVRYAVAGPPLRDPCLQLPDCKRNQSGALSLKEHMSCRHPAPRGVTNVNREQRPAEIVCFMRCIHEEQCSRVRRQVLQLTLRCPNKPSRPAIPIIREIEGGPPDWQVVNCGLDLLALKGCSCVLELQEGVVLLCSSCSARIQGDHVLYGVPDPVVIHVLAACRPKGIRLHAFCDL